MKKKNGIWRIPVLIVIFCVYFSPFYILTVISFKSQLQMGIPSGSHPG